MNVYYQLSRKVWRTLSRKWWWNTLGNPVSTHLRKVLKKRVGRPFIGARSKLFIGSATQPFLLNGGWQIIKMVSFLFAWRNSWYNIRRVSCPFLWSSTILFQWRVYQPSQPHMWILNKPFYKGLANISNSFEEGSSNLLIPS